MRDASDRQLEYLDDLGYRGQEPETLAIASMAIDMLKAGKSAAKVERAVANANLNPDRNPFEKNRSKGCSCLFWLLIAIVVVLFLPLVAALLVAPPAK